MTNPTEKSWEEELREMAQLPPNEIDIGNKVIVAHLDRHIEWIKRIVQSTREKTLEEVKEKIEGLGRNTNDLSAAHYVHGYNEAVSEVKEILALLNQKTL
jgi:hypothetical protein